MNAFVVAKEFAEDIARIRTKAGLSHALSKACEGVGIRYFALSHHVDFASSPGGLRLHNYPNGWEEWYDENHHGASDPIHRASHVTARGFLWRDVPRMIAMTMGDRDLLDNGRRVGLGEGVTIPAHIPGEAKGSCTFVSKAGSPLPDDALPWAQLVGLFAFEGARRILGQRKHPPPPRISDRQRECIMLAGRGSRTAEIARKLGIGEQTVLEHLREARARHGVTSRTQLVVRLLAHGSLCFDDVMHPPS